MAKNGAEWNRSKIRNGLRNGLEDGVKTENNLRWNTPLRKSIDHGISPYDHTSRLPANKKALSTYQSSTQHLLSSKAS